MKKDIYKKCFNHPPFFFYIKQKPIKIIRGDRVHILTPKIKKFVVRELSRNLSKSYDKFQSNIESIKILDRIIFYYNGVFINSCNIIIINFQNIYSDSVYCEKDFMFKVIETISHETIHYVLKTTINKKACRDFDNIYLNLREDGYIL